MSGLPLDTEAIRASAVRLASSDSLSGHLNNALQIVQLCATSYQSGALVVMGRDEFEGMLTRVYAALELITVIPAASKKRNAPALVEGVDVDSFTVTDEGRAALAAPASSDVDEPAPAPSSRELYAAAQAAGDTVGHEWARSQSQSRPHPYDAASQRLDRIINEVRDGEGPDLEREV